MASRQQQIPTSSCCSWRRDGGRILRPMYGSCIPIGGDGSKLGANHSMVTWAMKCFALDQKRELVKGFQHPTTQERIFPLLMCKCKEDLVELKQYAGEMLKTFESWEKDGWTSSATGIKYDVQLYVTGDMKWLRTVCGQKSAGADHFCYMCLCHKNDRGDLSRMGHPMRDAATADKTTPGMAHDRSLPSFILCL
eukprot:g38501.t1